MQKARVVWAHASSCRCTNVFRAVAVAAAVSLAVQLLRLITADEGVCRMLKQLPCAALTPRSRLQLRVSHPNLLYCCLSTTHEKRSAAHSLPCCSPPGLWLTDIACSALSTPSGE